jgi:membrane protein DedA with SNARE-associated domain
MQEWIITIVNSLGYLGIGLLMFLENLFPPIPSELIMPLAGFSAAKGTLELPYVILAGVVGTVLGALPWYYASQLLGEDTLKLLADKYGRWLAISSRDIAKAVGWFDRHDTKAVFLCRLVPGVRTLISIPAGISKMPMGEFLLYSTLGTLLWTVFLTYAGYLLGNNYHRVETYLGPVSKLVLLSLVIGFLFWLAMRQLQRRSL